MTVESSGLNLAQAINQIGRRIRVARQRETEKDYEGARVQLAQAKEILVTIYGAGYTQSHPILVACERQIHLTEETLP